MIDFMTELRKIAGEDSAVEHWTADAAHDDFWCPLPDQFDEVRHISDLCANIFGKTMDVNLHLTRMALGGMSRSLETEKELQEVK